MNKFIGISPPSASPYGHSLLRFLLRAILLERNMVSALADAFVHFNSTSRLLRMINACKFIASSSWSENKLNFRNFSPATLHKVGAQIFCLPINQRERNQISVANGTQIHLNLKSILTARAEAIGGRMARFRKLFYFFLSLSSSKGHMPSHAINHTAPPTRCCETITSFKERQTCFMEMS